MQSKIVKTVKFNTFAVGKIINIFHVVKCISKNKICFRSNVTEMYPYLQNW